MNKSRRLTRVIPIILSLIILSLSFSAQGATHKVCKIGCELSSISEAIDRSSSGDEIMVQNGNYSENLRIDKNITINGTNSRWVTVTSSAPESPAIVVGPSSATVKISNVTVTGEGQRPQSGIVVTGESRLMLTDSRIRNFLTGLQVEDSSNLKIRNSKLSDAEIGVNGIDNSEIIVSSSEIVSANRGVLVGNSSEIALADVDVTNCSSSGLFGEGTAQINILTSSISSNQAPGIVLKNFSRLTMENTQVSSNEGGGVLVKNSAIANLINNKINYNNKKNVSVITKNCGFSGANDSFFGEVNGSNNEIKPANSNTICPSKFSRITSSEGGSYSYPFKSGTYAFLGLVSVAMLYFLISR